MPKQHQRCMSANRRASCATSAGANALIGSLVRFNFAIAAITLVSLPWTFPGTNLPVSVLLSLIPAAFLGGVYVLFGIAMPRSGGDYVFISRTLHPSIGLAANMSATAWNLIILGVYANWVATIGLSACSRRSASPPAVRGGLTGRRSSAQPVGVRSGHGRDSDHHRGALEPECGSAPAKSALLRRHSRHSHDHCGARIYESRDVHLPLRQAVVVRRVHARCRQGRVCASCGRVERRQANNPGHSVSLSQHAVCDVCGVHRRRGTKCPQVDSVLDLRHGDRRRDRVLRDGAVAVHTWGEDFLAAAWTLNAARPIRLLPRRTSTSWPRSRTPM